MSEPHVETPETLLDAEAADSGDALRALGLASVGSALSDRQARDWALVLQSMSIWHVARKSHRGWLLLVRVADEHRARLAIERYELENRDWPPRPARERLAPPSGWAAIAFLGLCAFFMVTGPARLGSRWFREGTAVADLVVGAEPFRAITALTLHADSVHILGNALSGTIFTSAVSRRLGGGAGAFAVLASGALGNLANALFHRATGGAWHASIGASTAVFGAVGVLVATQVALDRDEVKAARTWIDVARPVAGGLALLGTLGASPQSDLGAHLFGFLAGLVVGGIAIAVGWRRSPSGARTASSLRAAPAWAQTVLGALTGMVVAGAWALALRA